MLMQKAVSAIFQSNSDWLVLCSYTGYCVLSSYYCYSSLCKPSCVPKCLKNVCFWSNGQLEILTSKCDIGSGWMTLPRIFRDSLARNALGHHVIPTFEQFHHPAGLEDVQGLCHIFFLFLFAALTSFKHSLNEVCPPPN